MYTSTVTSNHPERHRDREATGLKRNAEETCLRLKSSLTLFVCKANLETHSSARSRVRDSSGVFWVSWLARAITAVDEQELKASISCPATSPSYLKLLSDVCSNFGHINLLYFAPILLRFDSRFVITKTRRQTMHGYTESAICRSNACEKAIAECICGGIDLKLTNWRTGPIFVWKVAQDFVWFPRR